MLSQENQTTQTQNIMPLVNTTETKTDWNIYVKLPNVMKENVNITTNNEELTITAQEQATDEQALVLRYKRKFSLPKSVDSEKVDAQLQDGILKVTLGKQESTSYKQISVN